MATTNKRMTINYKAEAANIVAEVRDGVAKDRILLIAFEIETLKVSQKTAKTSRITSRRRKRTPRIWRPIRLGTLRVA